LHGRTHQPNQTSSSDQSNFAKSAALSQLSFPTVQLINLVLANYLCFIFAPFVTGSFLSPSQNSPKTWSTAGARMRLFAPRSAAHMSLGEIALGRHKPKKWRKACCQFAPRLTPIYHLRSASLDCSINYSSALVGASLRC
jgi:hypothetical protein